MCLSAQGLAAAWAFIPATFVPINTEPGAMLLSCFDWSGQQLGCVLLPDAISFPQLGP